MPRVLSLHRFPVKSMLGESVQHLDLDERGCAGDRLWSVRTASDKIGSGKNTRRFRALDGLLRARARHIDGSVLVAFPDGATCAVTDREAADRLSRLVGQSVTFAMESTVSHFDDGPVSLLGSASFAAVAEERGEPVDFSRFRANIVVETADPFTEEAWIGRRVHVGTAVLEVTMASTRCVMVNAETADLPAQVGNLAAIGRLNDARLGAVASVVTPGRIAVGQALLVESAASPLSG